MKHILLCISIIAAAAALASRVAMAEDTKPQIADDSASASAAAKGRQAYIDPETGELRAPSREALRQSIPARRLGTTREPVEVLRLDGGIRLIRLGPGHWPASQARIDESGNIETGHGLKADATVE